MTLTVGSLFAGIGGFDLGLERAGMRTLWQVEADPFCREVLAAHFPQARRFDDVRTVGAATLEPVDVLCGGFPCQDLSDAGAKAGLDGARSGLWSEFHRLVGELGPRYVLVENVPGLRRRGLGRVLGDLASLGYDAEWDSIRASDVGAPHKRERLWIVAYPNGDGGAAAGALAEVADARRRRDAAGGGPGAGDLPDAAGDGRPQGPGLREGRPRVFRRGRLDHGRRRARREQWAAEPDVGRVADGVPGRVDRLRTLGNALVPQIAQLIGEQIVAWEADSRSS